MRSVLKDFRMAAASNLLFQVNNGNTRKVCDICSKLTIKSSEWCYNVVLLSLLLTLNRFVTLF